MKKNIFNILTIISLIACLISYVSSETLKYLPLNLIIALILGSTIGLTAILLYSILDMFLKNNKVLNIILLVRFIMIGGIALTIVLGYVFFTILELEYTVLDLSKLLKFVYEAFNGLSLIIFGIVVTGTLGLGIMKTKINYLIPNLIGIFLLLIRFLLNIIYYIRSLMYSDVSLYIWGAEFGYAQHIPVNYFLCSIFLTIGLISFSILNYLNAKSQIK